MASKHHAFCFTWHNYTDENESSLRAWAEKRCSFLCYHYEVADSGSPHLQGMLWTLEPMKLFDIQRVGKSKKMFGFWPIVQRGNITQNRVYIVEGVKDGTPKKHVEGKTTHFEWGTWPTDEQFEAQSPKGQGKRTDLESLRDDIRDNNPKTRKLYDDHLSVCVRYPQAVAKLRELYHPPPEVYNHDLQAYNVWIYGEPGLGKTSYARKLISEKHPETWTTKDNTKWFPSDYNGTDAIIIEDFDPSNEYLLGPLKRWSDRHSCQGEFKGASLTINPIAVYVTSNHSIESCFPQASKFDIEALKRRFHVIHFTSLLQYHP